MNTHMIIEIIGYIGSAIVLVSFLMTSVFKLRVVNTVGSVIFMIYALIIQSYPTALMNLCLALINIHFLWKMRHTGRQYELVQIEPEDRYLRYLIERQMSDIQKCFPGIDLSEVEKTGAITCYLVTCQGAPAGITIGKPDKEGTMDLILDYSFPEYRDFSIGKYLCSQLAEQGIRRLVYKGPTANHTAYLSELEFTENEGVYEKLLRKNKGHGRN